MATVGILRYPELPRNSLLELHSPWNNLIRALEHRDALANSGDLTATHEDVTITNSLIHTGTTAGFYGSTPISQPTVLTTSVTDIVDLTYGVEERDVINNLRVRLDELESKLQALGLLA